MSGSNCSAISNALRKYGFDAFVFEVIDYALSENELSQKEIDHIAAHNSIAPNGYNLTSGGEGSQVQYSEATKAKMRASHKRTKTFLGRKHSSETKERISKLKKGQPTWNKGLPCSEEQKILISRATKGRKAPNKGKCLYEVHGPNCVFETIQAAGLFFGVTPQAIRLRCKRNPEKWRLVCR